MPQIHATAQVDIKAQLADDVVVGPFAIIGPQVRIESHSVVNAYAQVVGHTMIGKSNIIHSHCVIGGPPQDKKYKGEPSRLEIGDRNTFRECVTVNLGTQQGGGVTRIADDNWVMAYVHIAHDCRIGSNTILANATQLAGHVEIGDWAILGGLTGVHQFVKIGAHAMTGAATYLSQDLPPYVMAAGNPAIAHGINSEGLRRRNFSEEQIQALKRAYKIIYKSGLTFSEALSQLDDPASLGAKSERESEAIKPLAQFLHAASRGIVR